jgi:hypothetical protein
MTVEQLLTNSKTLADSFDEVVNTLEFQASDRTRLGAALLDQAHEHHKAIRLLLSNSTVGSAFSLVRILFETTVRGIWLLRCATDAEVEEFKADTIRKTFGMLVNEVEDLFGTSGGVLSNIRTNYWQAMCSYAHGGYLQAVRRLTPEHITPIYSEDEKKEALQFADFCFVLASVEIFSVTNRPELAEKWGQYFAHEQPGA